MVTVVGNNIAFKVAAKLLQIETWLLLTVYQKLSSPYPTVPSLTSYHVPFRHNARFTDIQTTYRAKNST